MSLEQRKPYNDMVLGNVAKSGDDLTRKFTSLGISYAELDAGHREMQEAHDIMLATIGNTIDNLDVKSSK